LKAFYEAFGTPHPRASLIVVMIISALLGAAAWLFAANQVEKDRKASRSAPSHVSGGASTSGDSSPAITGDRNNINYGSSTSPPKEQKPTK